MDSDHPLDESGTVLVGDLTLLVHVSGVRVGPLLTLEVLLINHLGVIGHHGGVVLILLIKFDPGGNVIADGKVSIGINIWVHGAQSRRGGRGGDMRGRGGGGGAGVGKDSGNNSSLLGSCGATNGGGGGGGGCGRLGDATSTGASLGGLRSVKREGRGRLAKGQGGGGRRRIIYACQLRQEMKKTNNKEQETYQRSSDRRAISGSSGGGGSGSGGSSSRGGNRGSRSRVSG